MRLEDIDWREVLNNWSEADIEHLISICNEKLQSRRWARLKGLFTDSAKS
jgi:hypothetical protein